MRRIAVAEWLLSCAMPLDRASSAAGDLAERAGTLAFSCSVVRLTVSASVRSLLRSPWQYFGGALILWCLWLLASILFNVAAGVAWELLRAFVSAVSSPGGSLEHFTYSTLWEAYRAVGERLVPAFVAWSIGVGVSRSSPGDELAGWYAIAATWWGITYRAHFEAPGLFWLPTFVLAGMLYARWRRLPKPTTLGA